jgi:allophanate hydrolase subunit 1
MASKKGIGFTVIILVGVVAASFLVYLIPEDTTMKFVVSDFEKHLDEIKEKKILLENSIQNSFEDMMDKKLDPVEYTEIAELSSSQVTLLAIELASSDATQEWTNSYVASIQSLKKLNEQIAETIVVANMLYTNADSGDIDKILEKINQLKEESLNLVKKSDNSRP